LGMGPKSEVGLLSYTTTVSCGVSEI
jgi:hypothetical protein